MLGFCFNGQENFRIPTSNSKIVRIRTRNCLNSYLKESVFVSKACTIRDSDSEVRKCQDFDVNVRKVSGFLLRNWYFDSKVRKMSELRLKRKYFLFKNQYNLGFLLKGQESFRILTLKSEKCQNSDSKIINSFFRVKKSAFWLKIFVKFPNFTPSVTTKTEIKTNLFRFSSPARNWNWNQSRFELKQKKKLKTWKPKLKCSQFSTAETKTEN